LKRTGTLVETTRLDICKATGTPPTSSQTEWCFEVEGHSVSIWSLNDEEQWATHGPRSVFVKMFGERYYVGGD
jgi:hypothetical protein